MTKEDLDALEAKLKGKPLMHTLLDASSYRILELISLAKEALELRKDNAMLLDLYNKIMEVWNQYEARATKPH